MTEKKIQEAGNEKLLKVFGGVVAQPLKPAPYMYFRPNSVISWFLTLTN